MPIALGTDFEVADPPTDSISSISFSPAADFLAAGSWDNNVWTHDFGDNISLKSDGMPGRRFVSTKLEMAGGKLRAWPCMHTKRLY